MIKYNIQRQKEILSVICNKCGKNLKVENGIVTEDFCAVNKLWGYFSENDGQRDMFDLCEECYNAIIADFIIPVEKNEEKELI